MKFTLAAIPVASTPKLHNPYLKSQARHSFYRVWLLYVAFLALYGIVFSFAQVEPVPLDVHLVGIFIAGACFFPLAKWIAARNGTLPMFELICVAYWMAFGLPIYTQTNDIVIYSQRRPFTWEETFSTLCIVFLGIVFFIVGYYWLGRWRGLSRVSKLDLPLNSQKFNLYAKIAVGTGAFLIALQAAGFELPDGGLAAFSRLLFAQIYIAIILLSYRADTRTATAAEKPLLLFAVTVAVMYGLAQGMLEVVLIPLVMIFIVRWQVKRRLPVGWLVVGLVSFFLLNSVKGEYRKQTWWSNQSLSFDQRIGIWLDLSQNLAQQTLQGQPSDERVSPWQRSLQRFDLLHQFIYMHNLTPRDVPFFDGSTYSYLLYGWIPRILWPGKPAASDATTTLALSYGFLLPSQVTTTAIGTGLLPEAYANFGVWGAALILTLQGMFIGLVSIILNGPRSEGGRAIYLSIMIFFLNGIGTQAAMLFSAIIPGIIGSALILRPFALAWSTTPKKSKTLRHLVRSRRKFEVAG